MSVAAGNRLVPAVDIFAKIAYHLTEAAEGTVPPLTSALEVTLPKLSFHIHIHSRSASLHHNQVLLFGRTVKIGLVVAVPSVVATSNEVSAEVLVA